MKGIHPGLVLERELKKRNIAKGPFALSIKEFPQTLGAITKGRRNMNANLAYRIEEALGMEEGFFMVLQAYYDMKLEKEKHQSKAKPDLSRIRPILFWDTDFDKLDWTRQKRAIIKRIFDRGLLSEKKEMIRFYGTDVVREVLPRKNRSSIKKDVLCIGIR
ncbi:Plasmid maintenance system antidote protein VapI, contains XRE-type HTH domain [Filimonas lacunae]|uniref:Plasmid maintenance system antidote protein VapI, contains XRE-type HTH domain n=2 Tax=Filimonas lacunae TaxID=477680 RepID=A0A1N7LTH6_9BACT|nr:Plasmid maintenance system antidote protein VapI, contains XRE-type HTH domain [Filimonas lacunae]